MKEHGIRFVVASGNQYYQLKSFFDEIQDEISYVAENGAFIVAQGQEVFAVDIPKKDIEPVIKELVSNNKFQIVLCGKESAYVLDSVSDEVKHAAKYIAPANIRSGVLEIIDQYFANQGPFKH